MNSVLRIKVISIQAIHNFILKFFDMVYKGTLFGIHTFCFSHHHQITVTNALTETYWLYRVMHASSKQFNDMNLLICEITFSLINLLIPMYAKYDLSDFCISLVIRSKCMSLSWSRNCCSIHFKKIVALLSLYNLYTFIVFQKHFVPCLFPSFLAWKVSNDKT